MSKGGDHHFLDEGPLLLMVLLSTYHMSVLAEGPSLATSWEGLVRWRKHHIGFGPGTGLFSMLLAVVVACRYMIAHTFYMQGFKLWASGLLCR